MKVNEWINLKFWQSIFIPLARCVEDAGRIRVQHKRCLRRATPTHTAKLCSEQICGKALNLHYICILYNLDIAIAPKVVLKHNWLTGKISVIHSWAKQENWFVWEYNPVNQFSILYSDNIGGCHNTATIL
ncbi:MAG: hypothetical protein V7L14_27105 [Nostoc sp.]|uniref:hypothetical protein n=1 Tax=Nostoc sp. TaxID=1180 RepID=UPI002FFB5A81